MFSNYRLRARVKVLSSPETSVTPEKKNAANIKQVEQMRAHHMYQNEERALHENERVLYVRNFCHVHDKINTTFLLGASATSFCERFLIISGEICTCGRNRIKNPRPRVAKYPERQNRRIVGVRNKTDQTPKL